MADGKDVQRADRVGKRRRLTPRQIVILVLIVVVVLFAALNLGETKIDLLFTSVKLPVVFAIAVSGLIGLAIGYLLARNIEGRD